MRGYIAVIPAVCTASEDPAEIGAVGYLVATIDADGREAVLDECRSYPEALQVAREIGAERGEPLCRLRIVM